MNTRANAQRRCEMCRSHDWIIFETCGRTIRTIMKTRVNERWTRHLYKTLDVQLPYLCMFFGRE